MIKKLLNHGVEGLIFAALRKVMDVHPVLGVSIVDESSLNPSWVRLAEIDLRKVTRFIKVDKQTTENEWSRNLQDAHQIPFENLDELPLWRVVVIEHITLSNEPADSTKTIDVGFFFHHGLCDGTSGVAFHMTFLDVLNTLASETDSFQSVDPIVAPPKLDLLPSIEEAHPLPLSLFFIASQVKSLLPSRTDNLLWTGPLIRATDNITHLRTLFLPAATVNGLLCRTKEHGVSLTSLLSVVISRVIATSYPEYQRFTSSTAMSFRRFTGNDNRVMHVYVSSFTHHFSSTYKRGYLSCSGEFSWKTVKSVKREIDAATASPKNHNVGLLKFLDDYGGFLKKKVGTKREHTFEISNVGVIDGGLDDASKEVKIKRILFTQSANVTGAVYVFSVASVKGGDLGIGLTWQDGIVDAELAEMVLLGVDSELRRLASI